MNGSSAHESGGNDSDLRTAIAPLAALDSAALAEAMRTYCAALGQHRVTIDRLNVYPVPDGDTGTNMAMTLAAVTEELEASPTSRAEVCRAISHGALMGARGNSGVIVSQLLRGLVAALGPPFDAPEAERPGEASDSDARRVRPDAEETRGVVGVAWHDDPPIDAAMLAEALVAASSAADGAVMRPVEGTILSVARAAAHAAQRSAEELAASGDPADGSRRLTVVLESAKRAGQRALEATPQQLPVLADAAVVDAGAAGYLLLLDALLSVVDGRPMPAEVDLPAEVAAVIAHGIAGTNSDVSAPAAMESPRAQMHRDLPRNAGSGGADPVAAGFGGDRPDGDSHDAHDPSGTRYEVMFLLAAPDENIDGFKTAWDALGDSIVMVGGDGLWNCHIHTDDIGPVIEAGIEAGRPHRIQITDLHEQVADLEDRGAHTGAHAADSAHGAHRGEAAAGARFKDHGGGSAQSARAAGRVEVECAVVAVSPAAGLDELLGALGVAEIVTGGQTMNPSTAELLVAVEAAPSQHVIVLPNNSNIVPVARQVDAHTRKNVEVVATTSVPAGLAAMFGYDPGADAAGNAASMNDAAAAVVAGEVTRAVRDTATSAGHVAAGQWIGLDDSGIAATGETAGAAAIALLAHLLQPTHEIVTLIEGAGAPSSETDDIVSWLSQHWPGVEVERHVGGQDHYPYLFGIE